MEKIKSLVETVRNSRRRHKQLSVHLQEKTTDDSILRTTSVRTMGKPKKKKPKSRSIDLSTPKAGGSDDEITAVKKLFKSNEKTDVQKSTQQLKQTELDLLKNENQKLREKVKDLMEEKGKLENILTEINRSSSLKSAGNKGQGGGKIPLLVTARPEDQTHEASAKMTSQNNKQKGGQKIPTLITAREEVTKEQPQQSPQAPAQTPERQTNTSNSTGLSGNSPKRIPVVNKNVLLLGSSIINRINHKGLKPNIHKHAVPGATINSMMIDVTLFNLKIFDTVIVYIGGNDAANKTEHELVEENYDKLVSQLKTANPTLKVYLSKIAPRGDVDVSPINAIVDRLAAHHSVNVIDIFKSFHDKHGRVCMSYIGNDSIHPSNSGTKRIAGTMDKVVSIVNDFESIVYAKPVARFGNRSNAFNARETHAPCLKCGEINHDTRSCRHRSPVTCWGCGFSGHKQQHCWKHA